MTTPQRKILTVIVPAYNMAGTIAQCLESLLVYEVSLLSLLDIIVVNDGSQDNTSSIVQEYVSKYSSVIRLINKANGNYGSCINAALQAAYGCYVKILDADDVFDTNSLSVFIKFLEDSLKNQEHVDVWINDFFWDDIRANKCKREVHHFESGRVLDVGKIPVITPQYMHSITYRTSLLKEIGYRQSEGLYYTDNEWSFYPMAKVRYLRYEPLPIYRYRLGRPGQTISAKIQSMKLYMFMVIALKMISSFQSDFWDDNVGMKKYGQAFLEMFISKVYDKAIVVFPTKDNLNLIRSFDLDVKKCMQEFRDRILDTKLVTTKFHFRYARAFLERRQLAVIPLLLYRMYRRCRG